MKTCIFSNRKCYPRTVNKDIDKMYSEDIEKFIKEICSMCVKKQYANAKERISKKKYVVVNTL